MVSSSARLAELEQLARRIKMSKKESKKSIKAEYEKIHIAGNPGWGRGSEAYVYITLKDAGYALETASQSFSIKEAKEIIGLIESAIKETTKKEKK